MERSDCVCICCLACLSSLCGWFFPLSLWLCLSLSVWLSWSCSSYSSVLALHRGSVCVFVCFALSHLESVFDLSLDESHGGVSVPSCEGHPCHVDDDSGKRQAPDILDIEAEACSRLNGYLSESPQCVGG